MADVRLAQPPPGDELVTRAELEAAMSRLEHRLRLLVLGILLPADLLGALAALLGG